jgi:hypothetical protein
MQPSDGVLFGSMFLVCFGVVAGLAVLGYANQPPERRPTQFEFQGGEVLDLIKPPDLTPPPKRER